MIEAYTIGLDFGTNSLRALLINTKNGDEIASDVYNYRYGESGIILDKENPLLARQNPKDYLNGLQSVINGVIKKANNAGNFDPSSIIGIGVDATASTVIPINTDGQPLSFDLKYRDNIDALARLWKDHTANNEAEEITDLAKKIRPEYLYQTGGSYSSEWFWSKILHCLHNAVNVFEDAATWVELCDWIPAVLTDKTKPDKIKRNVCSAGHKGLYNELWGGWPEIEFLSQLDHRLSKIFATLPKKAGQIGEPFGGLSLKWAQRLGLKPGIAVAVGSVDAHIGALGAGIGPGILVKIIGTSGVDMMVAASDMNIQSTRGFAGIVTDSILPGYISLEAGQSALGDIYQWFVNMVAPNEKSIHSRLQTEAALLKPGQSGLLALDWNNGNRTILMDQRLTGIIVGLTLQSSRADIYRSLVEATAFGNKIITEHFEGSGIKIERIVIGGGIALKSPFIMQVFSDILNRPLEIASSSQTGALGSSITAAVAAGSSVGGYDNFEDAKSRMIHAPVEIFYPKKDHVSIYDELYSIYKTLHDNFGRQETNADISSVMKSLISIRERT